MEIIFLPKAEEHLLYYQNNNKKILLKRITDLINDIIINPFIGLGKPEPLKYDLAGKWSRRIDKQNRLVYAIIDGTLYIYTLKGHY